MLLFLIREWVENLAGCRTLRFAVHCPWPTAWPFLLGAKLRMVLVADRLTVSRGLYCCNMPAARAAETMMYVHMADAGLRKQS